MTFAHLIPPLCESDADKALLALSKLRDRLVWGDYLAAAEKVDDAIEAVRAAVRGICEGDPR